MENENKIKQITRYRGHHCNIDMKNGDVVEGILAYYNLNEQMIHLNRFKTTTSEGSVTKTERGELMVINKCAWLTIKIDGEVIKNE